MYKAMRGMPYDICEVAPCSGMQAGACMVSGQARGSARLLSFTRCYPHLPEDPGAEPSVEPASVHEGWRGLIRHLQHMGPCSLNQRRARAPFGTFSLGDVPHALQRAAELALGAALGVKLHLHASHLLAASDSDERHTLLFVATSREGRIELLPGSSLSDLHLHHETVWHGRRRGGGARRAGARISWPRSQHSPRRRNASGDSALA